MQWEMRPRAQCVFCVQGAHAADTNTSVSIIHVSIYPNEHEDTTSLDQPDRGELLMEAPRRA